MHRRDRSLKGIGAKLLHSASKKSCRTKPTSLVPTSVDQTVLELVPATLARNERSGFSTRVEKNGKRLIIRLIANLDDEQYLLILEEQQLHTFSMASLELLGLTKREAEVLLWVAKDKSNPEIAAILGCSTETVKKYLDHVYGKWGVKSRLAAVTYAMEQLGMIPLKGS